MASFKRQSRLNSLLVEVLSETLFKEVKNPKIHPLTTVVRVDITKDLRQAKVYVSIIADDKERQQTLGELNKATGFISVQAARKVTLRFFPTLCFYLDETVDKQMRIERLIHDIHQQEATRSES